MFLTEHFKRNLHRSAPNDAGIMVSILWSIIIPLETIHF